MSAANKSEYFNVGKSKIVIVRRDKGDLATNFAVSGELLSTISLLQASFSQGSARYANEINHYYAGIVFALYSA